MFPRLSVAENFRMAGYGAGVTGAAYTERLDKALLEASADLGATPWQTLTRVVLPLCKPGFRAGALLAFEGKELGLGVVNPRTERVESEVEIRNSIEHALRIYPPDRLFLNPDCGFATFSNRPVNASSVATAKVRAIVAAARTLRGGA